MAKRGVKGRKTNSRKEQGNPGSNRTSNSSANTIKVAEEVALSAFASGLRLAAAFGTVAAKTTSLALASLASGADTFSELVKKEALASSSRRSTARSRHRSRLTHKVESAR